MDTAPLFEVSVEANFLDVMVVVVKVLKVCQTHIVQHLIALAASKKLEFYRQ
ncbi:MAG: hypothetical protein M1294_03430 [Firmicutes bacterium]|jgi:hypothetical protein|nr:hypothetical protein [Bacillota bacterium]MCL5015803.1 hypothetical protein [Bacillota bacterium]